MIRYLHERTPRPPKLRKRKRPHQSRSRIRNAIEGSDGNWAVLAQRLDCAVSTIQRVLQRPEYELLLQAFQDERLKAVERCKQNIFDIANHCPVPADRLRANAFLVKHLDKHFHQSSRVTVEGGDRPIQHQHAVVQIPADVLDLPVEARLKVLELADEREQELRDADGE